MFFHLHCQGKLIKESLLVQIRLYRSMIPSDVASSYLALLDSSISFRDKLQKTLQVSMYKKLQRPQKGN